MRKKLSYILYRIIRWFVWLFYPKMEAVGVENLPEEPVIVVGNHCQMNGPIVSELYFPVKRRTWCAGQMMHLKDVPDYAFQDFWSQKPRFWRPFYRLLSYIIAPLSVCIFNNAQTIAVYHDTRVISTFKQTVKTLSDGKSVVIFPEHDVPYNHILCEFQDKFIDAARLYYKKTGKELAFVPMYLAPKLKKLYLGKPIRYQAGTPMEQERDRIRTYLMEEITAIAEGLPEHTVVPYRNISRKKYPSSKEGVYEKTGG